MRRLNTVVEMVACCRDDSIHVLTKDSAVTGAQLCQYGSCLPWQSLFGCGNGRPPPIATAEQTRILVDTADDRLVAGVAEWICLRGIARCLVAVQSL